MLVKHGCSPVPRDNCSVLDTKRISTVANEPINADLIFYFLFYKMKFQIKKFVRGFEKTKKV